MNSIRKTLLAAALALPLTAPAQETDPDTGFVIAEGWQMVKGICTACHSAKLVTAQRGTRQTWLDIIRWMQESQGLGELGPETEDIILAYLAEHYAPGDAYRRMPIPPQLMPPNPYKQTDGQTAQN